MYCITDEQIAYILNDIRRNGIEMEDLQLNLLDHICCIVEQNLKEDDDFESFYHQTVRQFYKRDLKEIEDETIKLLTYKNYYAMKKIMIASGVISVIGFTAGSFLKIMHMPGAGVLLVLGMLMLSLVFLPLVVLLKLKESNNSREKLVMVTGAFIGMLYTISILFALNAWPGATMLWLITAGLSMFVFIPIYFFTGIRKPETKLNTIVTSVLLVGATGLLFAMISLKKVRAQQGQTHTTSIQQPSERN